MHTKSTLLLLILLFTIGTIEAQQPTVPSVPTMLAQQPPMPPMPTAHVMIARVNPDITNTIPKTKTFTVSCPHGHGKMHLPASSISTNGGRAVTGGVIMERVITFSCPVGQEKFDAKNEKFVPEVIAVEDDAPSGASVPAPSMFNSTNTQASTWTTDPNLRLTIYRTATGVCVTFPTETNKVYECQANDGGAWLGSMKIIGTGQSVMQCELLNHPNRMYRVSETPLNPFFTVDGKTVTVLPDTNAPTVTMTNVRQAVVTDFTNHIKFQYSIQNRPIYWTDPETGLSPSKIFEIRFPTFSNNFYTAWYSAAIDTWKEYPTDKQLHPARSDAPSGISVPFYDGNRFYQIRSFNGSNRYIWQ